MNKSKFLCVLFVCIFAISAFADLAAKQAEQKKVWQYIQGLDAKIIAARDKNQTDKVIELKDLKRMAMIRVKDLKIEIAKEEGDVISSAPIIESQEKVVVKEVVLTEASKRTPGFLAKAGFGGGGLMVLGGFVKPHESFDVLVDAGLAMGNQYSVMILDVAARVWMDERFAGLGLTYANYSETVTDIPGLSGNIEKGGKIGAEVFGGLMLQKDMTAQVGYNTALGLVACVGYKF